MAVRPYDEAYAIPTEKSQRIALRTQQILMHETGICDTVDPLAGSYYVESLTTEMEQRMVECIEEVERMGGVVRAIESGFIQRVIAQQAYEEERKLQSGEKVKVGFNKFVDADAEDELFLFQYDPTTAERQIARLQKVKAEREQGKVHSALKGVSKAVRAGDNVMPATLQAVQAYATLGEITKVLRQEFGEFKEPLEF